MRMPRNSSAQRLRTMLLKPIFAFVLVCFSGLIAHEGGHCVAAYLFGGKVTHLVFIPGIQILPTFAKVPWNGTFGSINYSLPPEGASIGEKNAIKFMGAGTTALFALAAASLALRIGKGTPRNILLAIGVLWPLDILTYSIFPNLGLRHWIFIGGLRAEPYEGAIGLGVPAPAYFALLGAYAIGIYFLTVRAFSLGKSIGG